MTKMPIVALLYDFDKTLCSRNMQEYQLIPDLGLTAEEFWEKSRVQSSEKGLERILSYLYLEKTLAEAQGFSITASYLTSLGASVALYPGVTSWFKRINEYGRKQGVTIEHYVLSSGQKEIIQGTPVASAFRDIYACEYLYDERGQILWPKRAVNYTQKTQYLYRISKGIFDIQDDEAVNARIDDAEKRVPFRNMIYIGDGLTDVPCMQIVKDHGGKAIAIYQKDQMEAVHRLMTDDRVNYAADANYEADSTLDDIVKLSIKNVATLERLLRMEKNQKSEMDGE